eukprot:CAMPEP_0197623520 /NCGR_PEP_ID=MMETSP1338-20131121/3518_1 /TAXON_ID=43686 ORGANISM="Pelagodinium beii, Strain RCC1491" /NCGR_SAMPLE_ID=MMETSP1338 /ASSEMBLY_ACC=CAM_ASM_000754 /LENGTH=39 /DNA_ID= /DNA_START= /DNA_END= /DNA_ORIENTATION=
MYWLPHCTQVAAMAGAVVLPPRAAYPPAPAKLLDAGVAT